MIILIALAECSDPFFDTPSRRRDAEWFAELWQASIAAARVSPANLRFLDVGVRSTKWFCGATAAPFEITFDAAPEPGAAAIMLNVILEMVVSVHGEGSTHSIDRLANPRTRIGGEASPAPVERWLHPLSPNNPGAGP